MHTTQRFLSENMKSVMVSLSEWGTGNEGNVFCFLSTLPVVGKHPDLLVGPPTSTVFPTNDRNFERSQFLTFVRNRQMIEIFREKKKKI